MKSILVNPEGLESINELIGALIFHWTLILIGPDRSLANVSRTDSICSIKVQRILIQQVVAATNSEEQSNLLSIWQGMSRDMMGQIRDLPYSSRVRKELVWHRNLLDQLIAEFREDIVANESVRRTSSG
jgi:hypothetical protein